jgi:exopolyphosphatase/pppGpp-phosphohydrolase
MRRRKKRKKRKKRTKRKTWQQAAIGAGGTRTTRAKLRAEEKGHVPVRDDH